MKKNQLNYFFGWLVVMMWAISPTSAQTTSADWYGKVSIGNSMSVHSDVTVHSQSELFLNAHNATDTLTVFGNYFGISGAKVYLSATDNANHNFLHLSGTANGTTELTPDLSDTWDGSDMDLVKAKHSESTAFCMPALGFQGCTARLNYRQEGEISIWYLTKSLPLIKQLGNHTLLANNNEGTNGGHSFVYYYWYQDGELIHQGSQEEYGGSYYTGGNALNSESQYEVETVDDAGKHYYSCPYRSVPSSIATRVNAYPNPAGSNGNYQVTVEITTDSPILLDKAVVEIYNYAGQYIDTVQLQGKRNAIINMPKIAGAYLLKFRSQGWETELKIIVQ
jgi:hypothetical protein